MAGAWDADVTPIEEWLRALDDDDSDVVIAALDVLHTHGPTLGRPLVDTLTGSRHKNMKELRPGSKGRSEVRMLFAFDPQRRATFLCAGDKAGNWRRWYTKNIRIADDLLDDHLTSVRRRRNP